MAEIVWANRLAQILSVLFHPIHTFLYAAVLLGEFSAALLGLVYLLPIISIYLILRLYGNFRWDYLTLFQRRTTYAIQLLWQCWALLAFSGFTFIAYVLWVSNIALVLLFIVGFWKKPSLHIAGNFVLLSGAWQLGLFGNWQQIALCITLLLAVGWARMCLRAHTLPEILGGLTIGLVAAMIAKIAVSC